MISLVRTFADEYGHWGIRANAVAPGNVGSGNEDQPEGEYDVNGINPLAAPRARDIANAVLFLCSDLAARVTGQTLAVDGGVTVHSPWGFKREHLQGCRSDVKAPVGGGASPRTVNTMHALDNGGNRMRTLFSADDHIVEPADVWSKRVPRKFLDAAPHVIDDGEMEFWVVEGTKMPTIGLNAVAGKPKRTGVSILSDSPT